MSDMVVSVVTIKRYSKRFWYDKCEWTFEWCNVASQAHTISGIAITFKNEQLESLYPFEEFIELQTSGKKRTHREKTEYTEQKHILISSVIASQIHALSQWKTSATHLHQNNIYRYTHSLCQQYGNIVNIVQKTGWHFLFDSCYLPVQLLNIASFCLFAALAYHCERENGKKEEANQKFHAYQKKEKIGFIDWVTRKSERGKYQEIKISI